VNRKPWLWICLLVLAAWASLVGQSSTTATEFILRSRADLVDDISRRYRLTPIRALDEDQQLFLVRGPADQDEDELEDEVDDDSDVQGFEVNQPAFLPEAPQGGRLNASTAAILETLPDQTPVSYFGAVVWNGYANQIASSALRLATLRTAFPTGTHTVAVIDTGIDPNHAALRDVLVPGFDFTRDAPGLPSEWTDLSASTAAILEQTRPGLFRSVIVNQSTAAILDASTAAILEGGGVDVPQAFGHGTMVAGLVHLVAPTARIMPLKAFRADGSSTLADILRAIYFAADNGARVINMSFSLQDASDELMRAINYANSRGVICIASAGNGGTEAVVFPAGFRHVIGIGAADNTGARSLFSNYGRGLVRLLLPGEGLITSYPGGKYAAASGTSFSGAIASGAAALLTHVDETTTQERADQLLAYGQQDLPKALQALADRRGDLPMPPPPPTPASPPPSTAATLLIADASGLSAGGAPNFFSSSDVNESTADFAARSPLRGLQARIGSIVTLATGQVGNEGWFALKSAPGAWRAAGPTLDALRNFAGDPALPFPHRVGPGLGTTDALGNREALLDKVPGVTPLRARGLKMLEGGRVCAVVHKGDVGINYGPLTGSLKGVKLGTVAFEVLSVTRAGTSATLPHLRVRVLDPREVCQSLKLLTSAPLPVSSSVPFDTVP
jgi:subtilisin family serine protease